MTIKVFSKKRVNTKTGVPFVSYFAYINEKPFSVHFCKGCEKPIFCPITINIGEKEKDWFIKVDKGFKTIFVRKYEEVVVEYEQV